MASNQQVAGRSVMTIRVGAGSNTSDTAARVAATPPVTAAAAADSGSHDNASQQSTDHTTSAVNIAFGN